jgi:hypothetical protein
MMLSGIMNTDKVGRKRHLARRVMAAYSNTSKNNTLRAYTGCRFLQK